MKRIAFQSMLLVGLALASLISVAGAQTPPEDRTTYVFMRISRGDGEMPMDHSWLTQIISSEGVFGQACRAVLKRDPGADEIKLHFTRASDASDSNGNGRNPVQVFATMTLVAKGGQVTEEQLREIAKVTGERFENAIDRLTSGERERMERDMRRLEAHFGETWNRAEKLEDMRRQLIQTAGLVYPSGESIRRLVDELQTQKNGLDLQLAGHKARTEALGRRIAELGEQIKKAAENDAIARELERVLAAREGDFQFEQKQFEAGMSSERSMQAAMAKVAEARAEVIRARNGAGADLQEQIARLNADLLAQSVDAAEAEARRAYVESKLMDIRKSNLVEVAERADALARELDRVRDEVVMTERELRSAREAVERFNPARVELIGLE